MWLNSSSRGAVDDGTVEMSALKSAGALKGGNRAAQTAGSYRGVDLRAIRTGAAAYAPTGVANHMPTAAPQGPEGKHGSHDELQPKVEPPSSGRMPRRTHTVKMHAVTDALLSPPAGGGVGDVATVPLTTDGTAAGAAVVLRDNPLQTNRRGQADALPPPSSASSGNRAAALQLYHRKTAGGGGGGGGVARGSHV